MAWIGQKKSPELTKKHPKSPPNSTSCSVRGLERCYIGNQPLWLYQMVLSKVIRAQDGVLTSQSGSPTGKSAWISQKMAKNIPKIASFAQSENPTGQPHCLFKSPHVRLSELKRWDFYITKCPPPTTKMAWIGQKTPKITPKMSRSALSGDPIDVTSVPNHSIFNNWS